LGIPTVGIVNLRGIARRMAYPRAVAVTFPRGATVGPPGRADIQMAVLRAAFERLHGDAPSGEIGDVPVTWTP